MRSRNHTRSTHGLAALALCIGCRSETASGSAASVGSVSRVVPGSPSFQHDVLPTIERDCSDPKGCHGVDRTDSVELDLTRAAAYQELVGHESDVRRGVMRVAPGKPEASFLVDKLTGRLQHDEGKRMPLDVVTGAPAEPNPVSSAFIEDVLVAWIRSGAKND